MALEAGRIKYVCWVPNSPSAIYGIFGFAGTPNNPEPKDWAGADKAMSYTGGPAGTPKVIPGIPPGNPIVIEFIGL